MRASDRGAARCPACDASVDPDAAFVCRSVPILLNVLVDREEHAREAPSGALCLHECRACGFVFNACFESVPYDARYVVDASLSARYRAHLDDVAERIAEVLPIDRGGGVVEVGAGQGVFLDHLLARHGDRIARAHGFDPAYRNERARSPKSSFTPSVLDGSSAEDLDFAPDVVVTRHVVEHLADPVAFLASFQMHIAGAFWLVVETPNVQHTLEHGLLHDFCYEHCSMFTDAALASALTRAGYLEVRVSTDLFGGEYLLAMARAPAGRSASPAQQRTPPPALDRKGLLAAVAERFVPLHAERLVRARALGAVAIWGGAGKGALFAHFVDPDRELVDFVIDIHPTKQGHYLPGAGHEVVSIEEARARGVRTVVVANPTYREEVATMCEMHALDVDMECVGDRAHARPARASDVTPRA